MVRFVQTAELLVEALEGYGLETGFKDLCTANPCSGWIRVKRGDVFVAEQHLEIARNMYGMASLVKHLLERLFGIVITSHNCRTVM